MFDPPAVFAGTDLGTHVRPFSPKLEHFLLVFKLVSANKLMLCIQKYIVDMNKLLFSKKLTVAPIKYW